MKTVKELLAETGFKGPVMTLAGAKEQLRQPDFRLIVFGANVGCPDVAVSTTNYEVSKMIVTAYERIKSKKSRAATEAQLTHMKLTLPKINEAFTKNFGRKITQESRLVGRRSDGATETLTFANFCDDIIIATCFEFVLHQTPIPVAENPTALQGKMLNEPLDLPMPTLRDEQRLADSDVLIPGKAK